ncbi:MAG TPA: MBL fold metallo-hydrolase [Gallionellaceae bacterium]|nr:MBL fold metallo-hydrolase [Gallionellaceae bacterium]
MAIELFNNGTHLCLMFDDLVDDSSGAAVQANQFLIVDHGHGALIDPGGNMTYNGLLMEMHNYFSPRHLEYILASHADPDIIASINKWMIHTDCKVLISKLWSRFIPHFCSAGNMEGRVQAIPDEGINIPLGKTMLKAIPAHFMHSEGNFQFYDPVSKILFSGDMGASIVRHDEADVPVEDFNSHIPLIDGFHRRYMVSNKICRFWVNMVRQMDVESIVPQHGRMFKGKKVVNEFLNWIEQLPCGVDTMTQAHYAIP